MLTYSVHGSLSGIVEAPISKSDLHRLILACSLAHGRTLIQRCTISEDIRATARVMQSAGATIQFQDNNILVEGISSHPTAPLQCDCSESGSTLRFLVPVFAALGYRATFIGHGKLPQRPMQPLLSELAAHGISITLPENGDALPLQISGTLQGGTFTFSGSISSQYITGLMFSLPLLEEDSRIVLTSPLESKGYVDMTVRVLQQFGVQINQTESGWEIPGRQKFHSPGQIVAQGDWSNAAFWICAGSICPKSEITVNGIDPSSLQGDKAVCNVLQQMGASLSIHQNSVSVKHSALHHTVIDASQIPDIIPILSVAAAVAEGETHIIHAERLRIKESDRLHAMYDCLNRIGADVTELKDGLIIRGKSILSGGTVHSFQDHRIAMSMAVASLVCKEPVLIQEPLCVAKSYPNFYKIFQSLGGTVNVVNMGEKY